MPPRKPVPKRTTQLPASLRTELESLGHINKSKKERKRRDLKGKGKAREEQSQKNRAAHFAEKKRKAIEDASVEESEAAGGGEGSSKRARLEQSPPKHQTPLEKLLLKQERKQSNGIVLGRKKTKVESAEDQEIAWLEAKLAMEKGGEDDDGLDDLFADVDDLERAAFGQESKDYSKLKLDLSFDSDEEEDSDDSDREEAEYGLSDQELIDPSDDDDHGEMGEIGSRNSSEEEDGIDFNVDNEAQGDEDEEEEEEWGGVQASEDEGDDGSESEEMEEEEEDDRDSEEEGREMELRWGMEDGDEEDESGNMVWTFDAEGNAIATPATTRKEDQPERKVVRFEDSSSINSGLNPATEKRYIPPHLRIPAASAPSDRPSATASSSSPAQEPPLDPRLRRVLLSHLNKLSSSNISNIVSSIVALYSSHPRAVLSNALSTLLIELISVKDTLGESFLVVYAALVAALGKEMGIEVGAGVVGKAVKAFDESRTLVKSSRAGSGGAGDFEGKPGSKEAENLVGFLSELYNFGVVGCEMVYGLIREFIDMDGQEKGMQELEVELLVRVIKRCGQQLRTDDPTALKEIVNLVKQKMQGVDPASINSRTKFMIESLTNLKNNKIKQLGSGADGSVDHYTPLKKFLSGLKKAAPDPLHLTLNDIRTSSSKGKWWIVGAAWSGDPLLDPKNQKLLSNIGGTIGDSGDDTLNQLAKKQGMNTDVRKSIFTVLMSSEDYVDACERLLQLGLSDVQQREIARVLLQCCGNEKVYNPYYTLVAQRLSQKSHSFQITLQYLLWDFLRELGEKKVGGEEMVKSLEDARGGDGKKVSKRKRENLAKLFGWCVGKEALSLMILKPLNFTSLQPLTTLFLRTFLSAVILSTQTTSPTLSLSTSSSSISARREKEVLERVLVRVAAHDGLMRGLAYFIEVDFAEADGEDVESGIGLGFGEQEKKVIRWGVKVAKATLSLGGSIVDVR